MAQTQAQLDKPVWEVKVRPIGEHQTPWETIKVRASSVIQAEAIMRRRGFEMATQSAILSDGDPARLPYSSKLLKPLVCSNCGYALAGLTLETGSVTCTECTYTQPLLAYSPDPKGLLDGHHPIVVLFTIIGILASILFLLLLLIPIIFAIV
ncbi:MAG: hypothetical protein ACX94C_10210 [Phycisphaerales bacterium]